jgi:hypothetical protein
MVVQLTGLTVSEAWEKENSVSEQEQVKKCGKHTVNFLREYF